MGLSFWHILILAMVVVILFGRGKISGFMGELADGIKSFKKGMAEDDEPPAQVTDGKTIEHTPATPMQSADPEKQQKVG